MFVNKDPVSSQIQAHLHSCENDMVESLKELINIPSVSDQPLEVARSLDYVLRLAKNLGLRAEKVLGGQVGVIEIGDGPETLGILAHVDVVPANSARGWISAPFRAEIREHAVYGRGSVDDKGPVIACLYSLYAIKESGIPLKKKIQLILGTQEEVDWTDMEAYTKAFSLPDYGFTPDGSFPVCNIEKGFVGIRLITEKGSDEILDKPYLVSLDGGIAQNTIPGHCRAIVRFGEKEIYHEAHGREAHSCLPEKGENAILKMCSFLSAIDLASTPYSRFITSILNYFTKEDCSAIGLKTINEFYEGEFIHRNLIAPTMIHTAADHMELFLNLRLAYGVTEEDVKAAFQLLSEKLGCRAELTGFMPAIFISREKPFMQAFAKAYENICGEDAGFAIEYGGSYAKAMPNIVSWGPLFPGEPDTCHAANEHITIESLMKNAAIFAEAILLIGASSKSFK